MAWVVLVVIVAVSLGALAHKPIAVGETYPTRDVAVQVFDPDVSQVIYTEIAPEAPSSWIFVETAGPFDLYVSLGVPAIDRLVDFRPSLAIVGPGLPEINLPGTFAMPGGSGAVLLGTTAISEPEAFFEPFTGTESWILLQQTVHLPEAGRYDIVALSGSDAADAGSQFGKLWMAIGTREKFGVRDIVSLPSVVRDVRVFHEMPPRISPAGWVRIGVLTAIAGLAVWAVVRAL